MICGYYLVTYLSLLIIFICARAIFPTEYLSEIGSEGQPDRIMPEMVRHLADPVWAGLLLAAPYAAIMSTVAAFLLMISSSVVRDLYQRTINPKVSDRTVKRLSYLATALVGVLVTVLALNPPGFLQYVIVFTGTGLGCSFLVPVALALYWRRTTRQGALAGMLGGFVTVVGLYAAGWIDSAAQARVREHEAALERAPHSAPERPEAAYWMKENLSWIPGWGEKRHDPFNPLFLGGVDTLVWGLLVSLVLCVGVSWCTRPDPRLAEKYFP
jgi:Na+/proline symporter